MALPALPTDQLLAMKRAQLLEYFCDYARRNEDVAIGRGFKYAIRVGSKTLWSDDTYELRSLFEKQIESEKRKARRRRLKTRGDGARPDRTILWRSRGGA
jgi:hypothetical protein